MVGGVVVVFVGDVVVPVVTLPEDLQADVSETDAMAVPAATIAALFRNCRLEYLVTRKMSFLPRLSCFSFSVIITPLEVAFTSALTSPNPGIFHELMINRGHFLIE